MILYYSLNEITRNHVMTCSDGLHAPVLVTNQEGVVRLKLIVMSDYYAMKGFSKFTLSPLFVGTIYFNMHMQV